MTRNGFVNLLYETTRCSFLTQEKNSALGMLWHLLNPLAMTLVIYVVFSNVGRLSDGIEHYPLYILAGIIHFNFFTHATTRAAEGLRNSRNLVLNTTVPLEILVLRAVCLEGLTYLIELALLAALVLVFGGGLTWNLLYYVFVFVGMLVFTVGVALLLSAVVVFLADLTYIWNVLTRMLFFLTPIFYSVEMVEHRVGVELIGLNPLGRMVVLGRTCLLDGQPLALSEIGWAFVAPAAALALGWTLFQSTKGQIPDYI